MVHPRPLDFSGIDDLSEILNSSVSGELVTVGEICAVGRTLRAARALLKQLEEVALDEGSSERYRLCYSCSLLKWVLDFFICVLALFI